MPLAFSVTPWDLTVLMPMTVDRLLLHTVPAVIFWLAGIGLRWEQDSELRRAPFGETVGANFLSAGR